MGFDICGESENYFRNNVWYWRPLWEYVCIVCADILDNKDIEGGCFNNGHFINEDKAFRIAIRLESLLKNGEVRKYKKEYTAKLKELPLEICNLCKDKKIKEKCNSCNGKGKKKNFGTWYPFLVNNVKEFAEFCKNSNGFRIY